MKNNIQSYKITSLEGMEVELLNLGATIRSLRLPLSSRKLDVVLGYEDIDDYKEDSFFMGATVGRFANRIAGGRFRISDEAFKLPINNGQNHLHGGPVGFAKRYWNLLESSEDSLVLGLMSEDGDQGYPGNLSVKAEYRLEPGLRLSVKYTATTDRATPVNLSSHAYFNLNGSELGSSVANHEVQLGSGFFAPVNDQMIPTGEMNSVQGGPFDLRGGVVLRDQIHSAHPQIQQAGGFDHNFIIDGKEDEFRFVGRVRSPEPGIAMSVYSNQPGVQFYTGNFLGKPFSKHQGLCLETQNFPDAPNKKAFPDSILRPGEAYCSQTAFEFDVVS